MKLNMIKPALLLLSVTALISCGGNSSQAPSSSATPAPGTSVPAEQSQNTPAGDSSATTPAGQSAAPAIEGDVKSIEVTKMPNKVTYVIGETFDPTGGEITATYDNGATEVVAMTDTRVTITPPNTKTTGKKNVRVSYGGASKIFTIQVTKESLTVTFQTNGGSDLSPVSVEKGKVLAMPDLPTKEGFLFDGWHVDEQLTITYDFSLAVTESFTLYAKWLTAGATIRTVGFDYGYYGAVPEKRLQRVEDGGKATPISVTPTRKGYEFAGWTLDGQAFDFDTPISSNIELVAKWTLVNTGAQTYVFEAEDVNFKGIIGKGLSGTATETACIVNQEGIGASNDRYVGFLFQYGLGLQFDITCDKEVSGVHFYARLSQFIEDYSYDKDSWAVTVNEVAIDYPTIVFHDVPAMVDSTATPLPFADFDLGEITLKKGHNVINVMTANNDAIQGTTMVSHAPLIDCLKFSGSDFVLDWDATKGFPYANY